LRTADLYEFLSIILVQVQASLLGKQPATCCRMNSVAGGIERERERSLMLIVDVPGTRVVVLNTDTKECTIKTLARTQNIRRYVLQHHTDRTTTHTHAGPTSAVRTFKYNRFHQVVTVIKYRPSSSAQQLSLIGHRACHHLPPSSHCVTTLG